MQGRVLLLMTVLLCAAPRVEAFIAINEILADPAGDLSGDANNDGIRSGSQDEFIEIVNAGSSTVNISSWSITDAVATRHVFSPNTFLSPYHYIVVFGAGAPSLPGINWQTASSGALGFNNTGDTVTLFDPDNQVVDRVVYASLANNNQSIVRSPEAAGAFVLHSQAQDGLFSPGAGGLDPDTSQSTVPELPSLVYLLLSLPAAFRAKP